MSRRTQNSARNSAKQPRGNPDKTKPFRWPKGISGNPGGRPQKRVGTKFLELWSDVKIEELPQAIRRELKQQEGLSLAAAGTLALYVSMCQGNPRAAKEIMDRLEGRVKQQVELDLTVDVNKDVVERLQAARKRSATREK
jgi:hypothetical protein